VARISRSHPVGPISIEIAIESLPTTPSPLPRQATDRLEFLPISMWKGLTPPLDVLAQVTAQAFLCIDGNDIAWLCRRLSCYDAAELAGMHSAIREGHRSRGRGRESSSGAHWHERYNRSALPRCCWPAAAAGDDCVRTGACRTSRPINSERSMPSRWRSAIPASSAAS